MKIIIAGAGNVGTHLAKLLSREKQDIILMDDDEEKLTALSSNFDLLTVTASPSSISGLKEVGVKEADLFIAVTPDESRNMTACMLATNLGAKKTVARIDNCLNRSGKFDVGKNLFHISRYDINLFIRPFFFSGVEFVVNDHLVNVLNGRAVERLIRKHHLQTVVVRRIVASGDGNAASCFPAAPELPGKKSAASFFSWLSGKEKRTLINRISVRRK